MTAVMDGSGVPADGVAGSLQRVLSPGRSVAWAALTFLLAGTSPIVLILGATAVLWAWLRRRREAVSIGSWLEHLLAMTAAMYAGMSVYMVLGRPWVAALDGAAGIGGTARYAAMLLSMAGGMVVLMRLERHGWRMCAEMCIAMVAPVAACFALVGVGIGRYVPLLEWLNPATAYDVAHAAMLLGMIALMAFRRAMYGSAASPACR